MESGSETSSFNLPQRGNAYQPRAFALGTSVGENRCVLKEHRIGKAGARFETRRLCGVPSERGFFCRADSQGLHPGLVCDAPLGHGIENVVAGLAPTEPRRPEGTRCPLGHGRGIGNVIVPLAPTGPRQRDGTRYPLGVWMRNRKRKSRSCGVQERLECESWEAGQALLFSGFLSDLFGSFFSSFFSGSGLGFGAFFLDGGLGGGEAGDGHAVWAA